MQAMSPLRGTEPPRTYIFSQNYRSRNSPQGVKSKTTIIKKNRQQEEIVAEPVVSLCSMHQHHGNIFPYHPANVDQVNCFR